MTATYTTPKTMGAEPTIYSDWNTYVRDNEEYLKLQADTRQMIVPIITPGTSLTTGDGQMKITIPALLNGYNLVAAHAAVYTVSSSGTPTVQIYNLTDTVDMLTTAITIDANELTSYTAAVAPVIDTAHDDVATGDIIRFDVDVAGTGTKGLEVHLKFQPA